jgi:hypothetical protein
MQGGLAGAGGARHQCAGLAPAAVSTSEALHRAGPIHQAPVGVAGPIVVPFLYRRSRHQCAPHQAERRREAERQHDRLQPLRKPKRYYEQLPPTARAGSRRTTAASPPAKIDGRGLGHQHDRGARSPSTPYQLDSWMTVPSRFRAALGGRHTRSVGQPDGHGPGPSQACHLSISTLALKRRRSRVRNDAPV